MHVIESVSIGANHQSNEYVIVLLKQHFIIRIHDLGQTKGEQSVNEMI